MQKKWIFLVLTAVLALSVFGGCSMGRTRAQGLSADDVIGMLGNDYATMKRSIGTLDDDMTEVRAKNYSYTRNILGADTDISVTMDDDDKVERIVIYTDENGLDTWKDALGSKYGVSASNTWRDDDTKVRVTDVGERKMIFIEKAV